MAQASSKPAPRSRAQILAELDARRTSLAGNVEDLIGRIHPTAIKRREIGKVKDLAQAEVDSVKAQVINPDGSPRLDRIVIIAGAVTGFITFVVVLKSIGRRRRRG